MVSGLLSIHLPTLVRGVVNKDCRGTMYRLRAIVLGREGNGLDNCSAIKSLLQ